MQTKQKRAVKNCLYITYDEFRVGGSIVRGQEYESHPQHEDEAIAWVPLKCHKRSDKKWWQAQAVEIDFDCRLDDSVYLVYVEYSTCSRFGRTKGEWMIAGIYPTRAEANQVKESIENGSYDGCCPWKGFNQHFESCGVQTMKVQP